ncbi:MAG: GNAT family N-acetyltransferase [Clostridium sp.]|uniref:GNAT family N-acetyltransferase n=1 Tax=Clostridium sp. TaxID=1506 RepID=UPI0025BE9487|nr:GNAT family N-acetyltransferase [Clostridium sp.]MCH3963676.1 GNAT family N-acetyltransferase [Clostridium sp.]MCI1714817.1 GNAT family N-acetyltransferase [Clostridium sp.]MCI1798994.1 GNAT family N-acetyltransferase [Clostridium sp.]MCI1813000.1 GNAT family N-acetyltransferase [Clostridium sp.]MCI1869890.1 GNAT family N-acetyltransferase [Clostridium sp.]
MPEIVIKKAAQKDIPLIFQLRELLFKESGFKDDFYIENVKEKTIDFYKNQYNENKMQHFIGYNSEGKVIGVAGSLIKNDFPYFLFKPGFYGWIVDVYTLPKFRKNGMASRLLDLNIQWIKSRGACEIQLLAFSKEAIKVYRDFGFKDVNVMKLNL